MTPGFRVFERGRAYAGRTSGIIGYRLDPATLAITAIDGEGDELFGFPPEEWRRPGFWFAHLHDEDREAAHAFFSSWSERPRSCEAQYRLVDANARVRWVHDIIEVRDGHSGREARGVLVDITHGVAGSGELLQAQRLRNELLRIFAEEVGGPVRSISAYADLLGRHLSSQSDHVGSDYAIGLHEDVQRLNALIGRAMRLAQAGDTGLGGILDGLSRIRRPGR